MGTGETTREKDIHTVTVRKTPIRSYFFLATVILVTIFTIPDEWNHSTVTWQHVWYYGWITAIATGLGAVPFIFIAEPNKFWMGVSNAIAGGMMLAASYSLVYEGSTFSDHSTAERTAYPRHHNYHQLAELSQTAQTPADHEQWHLHWMSCSLFKTCCGIFVGLMFITFTKRVLDGYGDIKLDVIKGVSAQRMILILFVMTLHSLTEGIGIGVSFGGKQGMQLGSFISLSLAMHNVPEGLAVALAATSRSVSPLQAGLWAITTSLPQPLTAVPAYLFVDRCIHILPIGLGFAAGAMGFVAIFELLAEAIEDAGIIVTGSVGIISCGAMVIAQEVVKAVI